MGHRGAVLVNVGPQTIGGDGSECRALVPHAPEHGRHIDSLARLARLRPGARLWSGGDCRTLEDFPLRISLHAFFDYGDDPFSKKKMWLARPAILNTPHVGRI
jgi:hypothetical protein